MAKGNTWIQAYLDHLFLNAAAPNVGDAAGLQPSSVTGNLYLSLHTADPGAGGNQSTSEATYTGYARVAVPRTAPGWTRSGQVVNLTSTVSFPVCTAGTNTITHAAIGTASSGAGELLYSGAVTPNIAVSNGITPQLTTASTVTET